MDNQLHRPNRCRQYIRHWFPIITRCPLSPFPDLVYVTLEFDDQFQELYEARRKIRKCISGRKMFMEDLAKDLFTTFPACKSVTLRLLCNRHVVWITNPLEETNAGNDA